ARARCRQSLHRRRAARDQPEHVRAQRSHVGQPGRLLRRAEEHRAGTHREVLEGLASLGQALRDSADAIGRHEAAAHDRARARPRAAPLDPRRADGRRRHRDPPLDVGVHARDQRQGNDDHPDDALPRGSGEPLPQRRNHRRGPDHRERRHGQRHRQAAARSVRAELARARQRRAGARGLHGEAAQRTRDRGRGREGAGVERRVRAAVRQGAARLEHAHEDESARGAVHSARRQAGAQIGMSVAIERAQAREPNLWRINLVGLWTIVRKETRRVVRIWIQTIVPPAITMTLYFIIFGSLVGSRIGSMDGVPYMTFIAPGLIMMAVITNSFANVVSSFFSSKLMLHLEEMLVAPLAHTTIVLGFVVGGVVRGLLVAALVVVVAMFFTDLHVAHPLITFTTILLTAVVFSIAGLFNAIFAKTFDDISIIPTFVLTPLTYLGGVFFSITLLPPFWQKVALVNPILYMVNAFRYGMLGSS